MPRRVLARSPCRIDLAGGTLDIWPLGLLHDGARTVNVALDVMVEVELERRESGYAVSAGERRIEADDLDTLAGDADAALFAVIAAALEMPPVAARLASESPRGGGLGASSALGTSLIAAADALAGRELREPSERARLVRDLEARMMGYPTGIQDQYPPMLGGALEIAYRAGGEVVRHLEMDLDRFSDALTLVYTGRSHFSGGTNWQVIRRRIEREEETTELFERICTVAREMAEALEAGELERAGTLLSEEWAARRRLAEGVSTPEIERILEAAGSAGSWGGKAGGAGGGGCVAILHPPAARGDVERAVSEAGGEVLAARAVAAGVVVETGPEA